MSWIAWVALGVAIVVLPIVIGMVFSSGRNMYGGPGTAGGGMFGPFEEIFAPSRHEAGKELEQQKLRKVDAGTPDGPGESTPEETDDAPAPPAAGQSVVRPGMSEDPAHIVTSAPPPGWLDGTRSKTS